jgi:glutamine amidotransferase
VFVKNRTELLKNIEDGLDFYFVHSYAFLDIHSEYTIGVTEYGQEFASVIQKKNIYGVQFHPEKSQKAGKLLLKNFLEIL